MTSPSPSPLATEPVRLTAKQLQALGLLADGKPHHGMELGARRGAAVFGSLVRRGLASTSGRGRLLGYSTAAEWTITEAGRLALQAREARR